MVPEEWPIAASAADRTVDSARAAASGRLPTVRADFFLDPKARLSEQERALMTAMLHCLVADVADSVRAAMPKGSVAANEDNTELVERLRLAGLLDRPDLLELLLRRADEERVGSAVRARGDRQARLVQSLVGDGDPAVSAAAMALVLARGRRRDRLGQPCLEFDDLSESAAGHIVHAVAATLRREVAHKHRAEDADRMLVAAARAQLDERDPAKSWDALVAGLAEALDDRADETLMAALADDGEVAILSALLARRASIPADVAWNRLLAGDARSLVLLLRVAGVSRKLAAQILVGLGDVLSISDPAAAIGIFDDMEADDVESARSWLRLPRAYRTSLEALGAASG